MRLRCTILYKGPALLNDKSNASNLLAYICLTILFRRIFHFSALTSYIKLSLCLFRRLLRFGDLLFLTTTK